MARPAKTAETLDISPDMAHKLLGSNTHNRKVKDKRVEAYAADMRAGAWEWNGEAIKFDIDGVLLDGQHRLLAIIESNATVPLLVVRGLPRETQETMDGGAKRTFGDILTLRGEHNATHLAAIVRQITLWEAGVRLHGAAGDFIPTTAQLSQTLEKYPWLRDVTRESAGISFGSGLSRSVVGLCWWLFFQLDPEDCKAFFEGVRSGEYMGKGSPMYELRRTITSMREGNVDRGNSYMIAITIKAWNAYRGGTDVGLLRFKPGGAMAEKFPEPR